eukprot:TRINITY_DN10184_c0_g1_i1.p1 TRINITY_DN10184_c0_g1~~TRINITY_DN10184_c0_g1_i1.p1  ORF type:complete len:381 (+),score=180.83 TRINITY_DN10184_c0_g1_i1:61-1143(+)
MAAGRRQFTVRCAGPLFGEDASVVLCFDSAPQTLDEVVAAADAAFTKEAEQRRGPVADGFRTARLRVFDWAQRQWHDLRSRRDWRGLLPGSVVYADPAGPVTSVVDVLDEDWRQGFERQEVPHAEKVRVTWEDVCGPAAGPLSIVQGGFSEEQLLTRLRELRIEVGPDVARGLFADADTDGDGAVSQQEWAAWAESYPNTVECMYFRGRDKAEVDAIRAAISDSTSQLRAHDQSTGPLQAELRTVSGRAAAVAAEVERLEGLKEELAGLRRRESELQAELGVVPADALRAKVVGMERRLAEFARRHDIISGHERELIEQEISVEQQKKSLQRSKDQMRGAVRSFDQVTSRHGSPRRAVQR